MFVGGKRSGNRLEGTAEKIAIGDFGGDIDAECGDGFDEHFDGDGLGINEHAIAIEDNEGRPRRFGPAGRRPPHQSVPWM